MENHRHFRKDPKIMSNFYVKYIHVLILNVVKIFFQRVDAKKLAKAQEVLAKKAEKKESSPVTNSNRYRSNEATASQVLSKKTETGNALLTKDINIEGFDVAFGEKVLLKNSELKLTFGRRYGMVGRNGLGKSTLLKMMSSRQLVLPSHLSILHVEQEV